MRRFILLALVLFFAMIFLSACNTEEGLEPGVTEEDEAVSHGGPITDYVSLVDALSAAGATVEPADTIEQPFFEPAARIIQVDGEDVQVFEFESEAAAEEAAATVSEDGTALGTTMLTWQDTPHFFREGRLIVLYVGSDNGVLGTLTELLGQQFAGG